jgi:hypothetical protein
MKFKLALKVPNMKENSKIEGTVIVNLHGFSAELKSSINSIGIY